MLYNRDYAKLQSGSSTLLEYAPRNVEIENTWYIPANADQLISLGYKEIIDAPCPSTDGQYFYYWEEGDTTLTKIWETLPDPPDTRTPAEKREAAYETKLCIVFPENSNDLITIDNGVKLIYEYNCEITDRAAEIVTYLKQQITEQKAIIREQFPDDE